MVYDKNKQNNAKQQNGGQQKPKVAVDGISPMVVDMFQQAHPNFQSPQTGFEEQKPMSGAPGGNIPAVGTVAQPMNFFGNGGGVQGAYDYTPNTPAPAPEYGTQGVQITDPAATKQNDLGGLSQALANAGSQPQQAQFQADPTQRDGGFFGWLGRLMPKNRPGLRDGESPDEYDDRMARNTKMYFTLADALRHLGNIVNTSKYAPLQRFNDPNAMIEQRYQQKKAERQKQAAMDADAAYKQANMDLKERAQQIENNYKQYLMGLKNDAAGLNRDKFDWRKGRDERDYKHKLEREAAGDAFKNKKFEADQQQRATSNSLRAQSIAKRGSGGGGRSGKGGSGSGGKYWFVDKDGKTRYQPNKTMWEQEYYREYGSLPQGETNTSTSSKSYDKNGEHTTTTRKKGASMTAQAAQQQNAAQRARKNQSARKGSKLKNVSALGL